jgi:hypothetical protein
MSVKYGTGSSKPHKSAAKPAAEHQEQTLISPNKKLRPLSFSLWSGKLKKSVCKWHTEGGDSL